MRARRNASEWCPRFLERLTWDIKLRRGAVRDYGIVGHVFANHLDLVTANPPEVDLPGLEACFSEADDPCVDPKMLRKWLWANLPRVARLIPARRMAMFCRGIEDAWVDGMLTAIEV